MYAGNAVNCKGRPRVTEFDIFTFVFVLIYYHLFIFYIIFCAVNQHASIGQKERLENAKKVEIKRWCYFYYNI